MICASIEGKDIVVYDIPLPEGDRQAGERTFRLEEGRPMATKEGYQYNNTTAHGKVLAFPSLIVAFDIDAPTPFFTETAASRSKALDGIISFLDKWSNKYHLGQYWIYQTGKGWHILFEKPAPVASQWVDCYETATRSAGWGECLGHWGKVQKKERATLRVGLKGTTGYTPREPDITLVCGEVNDLSPLHIRTHAQAVAQYQVYGEEE